MGLEGTCSEALMRFGSMTIALKINEFFDEIFMLFDSLNRLGSGQGIEHQFICAAELLTAYILFYSGAFRTLFRLFISQSVHWVFDGESPTLPAHYSQCYY